MTGIHYVIETHAQPGALRKRTLTCDRLGPSTVDRRELATSIEIRCPFDGTWRALPMCSRRCKDYVTGGWKIKFYFHIRPKGKPHA